MIPALQAQFHHHPARLTEAAKKGAVGGFLVKAMHHLTPQNVDHHMTSREMEVKDQKNKRKESSGGKK
ncbi:hypothetical protein FJTKL_06747 [Diaporthe vaccinii]|uniref:Uncharacterized protein n=1 Tax=Diaporthe vaccinii TaxID=105482 RepID=A0ABR4DTA5_9PEZI